VSSIKAGVIQMSLKGATSDPIPVIRDAMLDAHEPMVESAAAAGVQILGFQEVFNQPYFPPSRDVRWYDASEKIPAGPSIERCRAWAKKHAMVIVAPIYEEEAPGVYYNSAAVIDADGSYLGKYRKTHIPDLANWPEKFFFRPGNLGFPVFDTAYCRLGVYICYDRHFPEGFRALALGGADLVITPSATGPHSRHIWELEFRAAAVANGLFIAGINRVGEEAPWNVARFFGNSFFCAPRGTVLAQGGDGDELVSAEIDLAVAREVRHEWQFFRDRRPDVYGILSDPARM
jgi:N-carbamoylputrescine amidase